LEKKIEKRKKEFRKIGECYYLSEQLGKLEQDSPNSYQDLITCVNSSPSVEQDIPDS
jgi:hypothetical protein